MAPRPQDPLPSSWRRAVGPVLEAVVGRPQLWPVALVTLWRLGRPGWWRHWPPVPAPPDDYWRFRMETAYGGRGEGAPSVHDVVAYLEWCRRGGRRRG